MGSRKQKIRTGRRVVVTLLVLFAAGYYLVSAFSSGDKRVWALFPSEATTVIRGTTVRAAGQPVGTVGEVQVSRGGVARVELTFDDDRVWPLPQGTKATVGWGGTVKYTGRHIDLELGPPDAAPIKEGGIIPASDVEPAVEIDEVLTSLDKEGRTDLGRLVRRGGRTLGAASDELRDALEVTPPGLRATDALLEDIGSDRRALDTLVRSGDQVMDAVATANPGTRELVTGAARTFAAFGRRAEEVEAGLVQAPETLSTARTVLEHADASLTDVNTLARRLGPGVPKVRALAAPLDDVLGRLLDVGPLARDTLATARRSAPDVTDLLATARPLTPELASIADQLDEQVHCIRPYAPDASGFGSAWTGFLSNGDKKDKYIRALVAESPAFPVTGTPLSSAQMAASMPGLVYAFPRPPGLNSGQPWFLPECGVGEDSLDPSKDPETGATDPDSRWMSQP